MRETKTQAAARRAAMPFSVGPDYAEAHLASTTWQIVQLGRSAWFELRRWARVGGRQLHKPVRRFRGFRAAYAALAGEAGPRAQTAGYRIAASYGGRVRTVEDAAR